MLLGAPTWFLVAYQFIFVIAIPWQHANIDVSLGPLWWLITNPEFHRWHHERSRISTNRNFSALLPLWDVAFGTHVLPRDRKARAYGLPYAMPSNYLDQILAPFSAEPPPTPKPRGIV